MFLGIKNTSTFQRVVYVRLQVYAITEKSIPSENFMTNGWSIENKRKMYTRWYKKAVSLGYNNTIAREIAICTQKYILNQYSFSDRKEMNSDLWNKRVIELFNQCIKNK